MIEWQACDSEETRKLHQYWVSMPYKESRYIGFYVKFEKEDDSEVILGDKFTIKSEEQFIGLLFPQFEKLYPKIFEHLCKSLDEHFIRPIVDEIRDNVNHSLAAIINGNVVLAMAVFEVAISENATDNTNFFACVERFRSMSCLEKSDIYRLGVFN
jgi:hypothetical protein